jgi:hypothetical protein
VRAKGVSSNQIAREIGCMLTIAWFLTQRIRECMQLEPVAGVLKGPVNRVTQKVEPDHPL